jgi:heme/copper-type cytochrome/quinol oxidase subunit 2
MAVVKRIGPGSAFKVGLVLYGLLGLLIGACITLLSLVGAGFMRSQNAPAPAIVGMIFGTLAIVIAPIFYGVIGGVVAALSAVLYNLAAKIIGGLEVDLG